VLPRKGRRPGGKASREAAHLFRKTSPTPAQVVA